MTATRLQNQNVKSLYVQVTTPYRDWLYPHSARPAGGGTATYAPSRYALEIIAPRAGLSTVNRYYKVYTGIAFAAPVIAIGGSYPFVYAITSGPAGLAIGANYGDANYGILTWASPTAGSHSITVTVTDKASTVASVTWTMTVQTTGFIFVDAANGSASTYNGGTGTGTIAAPFKTINDWYSGSATPTRKGDTTWSDYTVYYRAGTYDTGTAFVEAADSGNRMPCVSNNKPKVHLAYPGESVTFDVSGGAFIYYSDTAGNYYFDGMTFSGISSTGDNKAFEWDSGTGINDIGAYNCTFNASTASSGANPSLVMCRDNTTYSNYIFMSHCTISNANSYDLFLGYRTSKVCLANNTISNNVGANASGFYAKIGSTYWDIRENTGITGNSKELYRVDGYSTSDYILVRHNNYKSTGHGDSLSATYTTAIGNVYSDRNTWQVAERYVENMTVNNLAVYYDVVQYTNITTTNSHGWWYYNAANPPSVTGTFTGEECVGTATFVTSAGVLTGAYTGYAGTHGHVIL